MVAPITQLPPITIDETNLLTRFVAHRFNLISLADELKRNIFELTAWLRQPHIQANLQAYLDLVKLQHEAEQAEARSAGIAHLIEIANTTQDEKERRRAATMLIRIGTLKPSANTKSRQGGLVTHSVTDAPGRGNSPIPEWGPADSINPVLSELPHPDSPQTSIPRGTVASPSPFSQTHMSGGAELPAGVAAEPAMHGQDLTSESAHCFDTDPGYQEIPQLMSCQPPS